MKIRVLHGVVEGWPGWNATPSTGANARGGVVESWTTTTTLALPLPFALAFAGVRRRGNGTRGATGGYIGWRRCRRSSWGSMLLEVAINGMERGQWLGVLDEGLHVVILLVEPMKKFEDEVMVRQLLTQGADLVYHALHLAVVVTDAKTTLSESTKLFIKLKDTSLIDAEKLSLDNKPRLSCRLRWFTDDLLELDGEGAKHPHQHDPVIVVPICSDIDLVGEDMIVEGIAT
jgi:hypothetical protein